MADVPNSAPAKRRKRIDPVKLKALTDAMPKQEEPAGALVRRVRDDSRY